MKHSSIVVQFIAVALAVLLPVEVAHCAWTMSPIGLSTSGMRADHACCRTDSTPAAPAEPARPASDCACLQLPQAVTQPVTLAPDTPESAQAVLVTAVDTAPAAASLLGSRVPQSSPVPASHAAAHPLRGPPTHS